MCHGHCNYCCCQWDCCCYCCRCLEKLVAAIPIDVIIVIAMALGPKYVFLFVEWDLLFFFLLYIFLLDICFSYIFVRPCCHHFFLLSSHAIFFRWFFFCKFSSSKVHPSDGMFGWYSFFCQINIWLFCASFLRGSIVKTLCCCPFIFLRKYNWIRCLTCRF